ncbi:MAG: sulfatase-like hydrolase/transferase [Planctomycetota bacterium]
MRSWLIFGLLCCWQSVSTADAPPNVVVIFADDLGYGDLGCYGATKVKTPNIDRLASQGRRFTDAHSASAVCTPSRYALLTGEYPHRRNLTKPVFLRTGLVIAPKQQTAASVMKDAGYDTACIGKWHLGFGEGAPDWNGELKPGPLEVGFDHYFGVPVVNSHPPFVYVEDHHVVGLVDDDPFVFGKRAKTREFFEKMGLSQIGGADAAHSLYDDEAVGTTLTGKAVEWIETRGEDPFFLYLATTNIHHPFTPAPRFQGTSGCGPYGDFIHELDWIVGEVMQALESKGVADNTLLIFTSDNGGMFNVGGQNAWDAGHRLNGQLLGFKFGAWEGGHRVPFIARWPGHIRSGSVSDQLISNIDLIATLAALTGRDLRTGQGRDSVNVLPAMTQDPAEPLRDHLILAPNRPTHLAVRKDNWIYIGAQGSGGFTAAKRGAHAFGGPAAITYAGYTNSDIEKGRIKKDAPPAQLYDLDRDLSQATNLYRQEPEVAKKLEELLQSYLVKGDTDTTDGAPTPPKKGSKSEAPMNERASTQVKPSQLAAARHAMSESARPNVIFMLTDDLGYSDLSCYGATKVKTPHIDRLAGNGLRFTQFRTGASICSPSRAAFLTGCYPQRCGLYMGINPKRDAHWFLGLHPNETTLAEQFRRAGYATYMVGKWHLGTEPEFLPSQQGFDHYYGMPCNFSHSPAFFENEVELFSKTPLERLTRLYTDRVTSVIRTQDERKEPFFLYYAHNYPHTPYRASKAFQGSSGDGMRGDVIQELDWSVGMMMDALRDAGIAENTIVVFASDNGPIKNEYAQPFRGTKYVTFEGGHRVPFIIHWPARITKPRVSDVMVTAMDLFPTLSEIIGVPVAGDRVIDGESLTPLFTAGSLQRSQEQPFYYYNCENLQAVKSGDWKLHLPRNKAQLPFWDKNKAFANLRAPVLYNLTDDVQETTNVAAEHPQVVARIMREANKTRTQLGEFMTRGAQQRVTGSLFPDIEEISHEKDWSTLEPSTRQSIQAVRIRRYPRLFAKKNDQPRNGTQRD